MAKRHAIFQKARLTPGQLRVVANRRLDDSRCLLNSRKRERANGAIYLAGFVVECLLKAMLLENYPSPWRIRSSKRDEEVLKLLYGHELDKILIFLPEIEKKLSCAMLSSGRSVWFALRNDICAQWTIYARYSSRLASLEEAREFFETVKEVKRWLELPRNNPHT